MARRPRRGHPILRTALVGVLIALSPAALHAGGSDVFVCVVGSSVAPTLGYYNFGSSGGIKAFAIQTFACNMGDTGASWVDSTNQHPVISENMFRLRGGRFEHIGQAWVKHGFYAETENGCTTCIQPVPYDGTILGVGCCDTYGATLNGYQPIMGPKSEVNAATGVFPYPFCQSGCIDPDTTIGRRIQVAETDLDTSAGVLYFIECQYVLQDDCYANPRTDYNNASYRQISLNPQGYLSTWQAGTMPGSPAILAWGAADPTVNTVSVDVPNDGRFYVAAKATNLGGGQWRYEYAVDNFNSDRSGSSFTVPIAQGATISNVGFHDVAYHSGELLDNTDWDSPPAGVTPRPSIMWSTHPYPTNPANANALRWATVYNFRFDANVPPSTGAVSIGLFKSGSPSYVFATTIVPSSCLCGGDLNGDGKIDGADVSRFVLAYLGTSPSVCADLAAPSGSVPDDADLAQFIALLLASPTCP